MTGLDRDIFRATRRLTTLLNEACNHWGYLRPYLEKLDIAANMALEGYQKDYPNDVDAIIKEDGESAVRHRRNCDVGTAEEQFERMFAFCQRKGKCVRCENHKIGTLFRECALRWAQMPYEEGGTK